MTPANPHDALFKALLSDPERAGAFMRDHLPNEVAGRLTRALPVLMDGSFVDETLRDTQSDLLFQVELQSGGNGFVYVLVEHKSSPDPAVALQLAGYMLRIWRRYADGGAGALRSLPPIIPMVCYHGSARWTVPAGIADLIASDDPALTYLPGERYILRDLTGMAHEDLSSNAALRAGFTAMRREAMAYLESVIRDLDGQDTLQKQVLEYIVRIYKDIDISELQARLHRAEQTELETHVGTIAETLMAEGEARGKAEGIAEGEAHGKAQTLLRLLKRRFETVDAGQCARIEAASIAQLDIWLDRIFDGASVEEVLDGQH